MGLGRYLTAGESDVVGADARAWDPRLDRPGSQSRGPRRSIGLAALAVIAIAGCGGTAEHARRDATTTLGSRARYSHAAASRKTLFLADSVCRAVRAGAPGPLRSPVTSTRLSAYARRALPYATRAQRSLTRVEQLDGTSPQLGRVQLDYATLTHLYLSASRAASARQLTHNAQTISNAEQIAGLDSRMAGLPLCAPFGPGLKSATR